MKKILSVLAFTLVFIFLNANTSFAASPWDTTDVNPYHNWTIEFNAGTNAATINGDNIYVTDGTNVVENVIVYPNENSKSVTVEAPPEGYKLGGTYFLYIENNVKSVTGSALKTPIVMEFTVTSDNIAKIIDIPDANLEQAIRNELRKAAGDITKEDMLRLSTLEVSRVSNFSGLENAENMISLSIYNSVAPNLSPLYHLSNLQTLNYQYSNLSDINWLAGLSNLQSLNLYGNNISDIEVLTKLPDLEKVDIRANPLDESAISVIDRLHSKAVAVAYDPIEVTNYPPTIIQEIPNQTIQAGETINLDLSQYFSDPDDSELIFTATKGTINGSEWSYIGSEAGEINVTITAADSKSQNASLTFTLVIEEESQQDTLYNSLYNALVNMETEIDISRFTTNTDVLQEELDDVLKDHPEIFYFDSGTLWSNGRFEIDYLYPQSEVLEMNNDLDQAADSIIGNYITTGMSDFEKVKAIHDYIVLNTAYDDDGNYNNGTLGTVFDIYGTLINRVAVCQGYAESMVYLLDKIGIDNLYVSGIANGENHGWNKVKIDGNWYNLDATWDDHVPNIQGYVWYKYFLLPDSTLTEDHSWDNTELPAATSTKYLYMSDMWDFYLYNNYYYYSSDSDDINLYKIKIDGTDKTKIADIRVNELVVVGDWIYFSNYSNGGYLYKIKTDGTQLTQLTNFLVSDLILDHSILQYNDEYGLLHFLFNIL